MINRYKGLKTPGVLSIQQKFCFEISETSRAHWTVHSGCTDLPQTTVRSQQTQNYALKEKSKYCLYPNEHSTAEKGRWKTHGGEIQIFFHENKKSKHKVLLDLFRK